MSTTPISYSGSASQEYVKVVREYVVRPLETSEVAESCFAAALLVFGAIDGLGKLTIEKAAAGSGERFKYFLLRMGVEYAALGKDLWLLRNSLIHSAMNAACFMSKTNEARGEHLERDHGFVFVHTVRLLEDFKRAIDGLESDLNTNAVLLQRAESRLIWDSINQSGWRGGAVTTTQPPGIRFVKER